MRPRPPTRRARIRPRRSRRGRTLEAEELGCHLAAIKEPGRIALYLDGELQEERELDARVALGDAPPLVGASRDSGAQLYGRADEIALFGRGLRDEEVRALSGGERMLDSPADEAVSGSSAARHHTRDGKI